MIREKIYPWILWLKGDVVRIKINGTSVFVESWLFEKFAKVAHEAYGPGEEALERAMEEGLRLAVAFEEGPEEFERVLDSLGGRKKPART